MEDRVELDYLIIVVSIAINVILVMYLSSATTNNAAIVDSKPILINDIVYKCKEQQTTP